MTGHIASDKGSILLPALAVLAGLAFFSAMDAVMKDLSIALGAYNAVLWRYAAGVVLVSAIYFSRRRKRPSRAAMRLYLIRGVLIAVMAFLFFWGLVRVPLAEGVALSFIAPLIALYLAAVLLKESIGRNAIFASLLGIAGVVVIVLGKMGSEFGPEAQWGVAAILLSASAYAYNLVLQRQMALIAGPMEIAFFQNIIVFICLLLVAPFFAVVPAIGHWPALTGAAALAIVSLLLVTWGYARAEAQYLVSLEYSAFIWAAIFGWYFFGEAVTWMTVAGTVLIVAGCLLVAMRRPKKAKTVEAAVG
ncbi:DMT family transporter [Parasphingopyxis sp.]|uniref:DMT family transporter n=1 Tax=Parasphingopyxis sp. TaxID=1920299 RepID=UPI00262BC092|nr:DMT family transporter [Parasphingopyxis sp.]